MPDESKGKSFPDVSAKLSALPKESLLERQKAEAEAKRVREKQRHLQSMKNLSNRSRTRIRLYRSHWMEDRMHLEAGVMIFPGVISQLPLRAAVAADH